MSHYRAHVILNDGDNVSNLLEEYGPDAVEEVPEYDLDVDTERNNLLDYVHGLVESNIDDAEIHDLYNAEEYIKILDKYGDERYYFNRSENVIYRLDSLQIWDSYNDLYGGRFGEELICLRDSKQYEKNRNAISEKITDDVTLNIMSYFSSTGRADELFIPGVSDEWLLQPFIKDLEAYIKKALVIKGKDISFSEEYDKEMKFNRNMLCVSFVEYGINAFLEQQKTLNITTHKEITKFVTDCLMQTLYCNNVEYMISADGLTSDQEDMLEWYNIAISNKSTITIVDLHN